MTSEPNSPSLKLIFKNTKIKIEELIYLYFTPSSHLLYLFLSCRPFVVITTLSTGLVGVEVTSVSWLGQLTVEV